jgi:outer membrane protein assembly complex protein YaeT
MGKKSKLWWAGAVAAVLLTVTAALLLILHSPPVKRYALERAQDYLLTALGIDFQADAISYNLVRGTATLRGVTIQSSTAPDLPPLLTAERAFVDVGVFTLLRGFLSISDAQLEGVSIQLIYDEEGRGNLPHVPEERIEEETGGAPQFLVSRLQARRLSLLFEDRRQPMRLSIPDSRLDVEGTVPDFDHTVIFATERPGEISLEGGVTPLTGLDFRLQLPGNLAGVELESLQLQAMDSTLQASGELRDFADPHLALEVSAHVNLAEARRLAALEEELSGRLSAQARLSGPLDALAAEGRVEGEDLAVQQFRELALRSNLNWDGQSGVLGFDDLRLDSPYGAVRGAGSLDTDFEAGRNSADLTLENLDLFALTRLLGSETHAATRVSGRVRAQWRGTDFPAADGSAQLRLRATRNQASRNILPLSGQLSLWSGDRRLRVSETRFETPGLRADIDATVTSLRNLEENPDGNLSGSIRAQVTDAGILAAGLTAFTGQSPPETEIAGAAVVDSSLGGTLQRPRVRALLQAPDLRVGDLDEVTLEAAVDATAEDVLIERLTAGWRNQTVYASGRIGLAGESPALDLRGRAENVSLQSLQAALEQDFPVSGVANLQARVEGTVEAPRVDLLLDVSGLRAYREPFGTLAVRATFHDQLLRLEELRLEKEDDQGEPAGRLTASGEYHLETESYQLRAESPALLINWLVIPGIGPVSGLLTFSAGGEGTVPDPEMDLRFDADDVLVAGESLGAFHAAGTVRNQAAHVRLEAPRFKLRAEGSARLEPPYPAEVTVLAENTDLSLLPVELPEGPLRGALRARVQAEGPLEDPAAGRAEATIEQFNLTLQNQLIENRGPIRLGYRGELITIEPGTVVTGASHLTVAGTFPVQPDGPEGEVRVESVVDLTDLTALLPPESGVRGSGRLELAGDIRGNLEALDPLLRITLRDGSISLPVLLTPLENLHLDAVLEDGRVLLQAFRGRLGDGALAAGGEIPLGLVPDLPPGLPRREGPASLTANLSQLSLQSLAALPPEMAGILTLRVEAEAPEADLAAVSARASFEELRLTLGNFHLEQQGESRLSLEQGVARVDQFLLTGPETRVEAAGTADLLGPAGVDLSVSGNMNAALLSAFVEDLQAAGEARFQLAVAGRAEDPQVNGFFEWTQGQIGVRDPALQLVDLDLRLDLEGNRVSIARLTGDLNGGSLTGGGRVDLSEGELQDINIDLSARNVFLELPQGMQTASNVDLEIRSQGEQIVIGGQAEIIQGSYTEPVNLEEELLGIVAAPSEIELAADRNPQLERIRFNVAIRNRDPILVQNNLARLSADLNLRLLGTYYEPGMTGRLELEEGGELYLRERTYYLERGIISFNNENRIEPFLDVTTRTEARAGGEDYEITLQISGEADNLETRLTSDPTLPEPDIVSVLVTGRLLEDARGDAAEVLRQQTVSLLAGGVAGRLGTELERATGLSRVRIEPNLIAAESDPTARLTIGQDITRQLEIIYSMNLADSTDQIYIGEYDLTRRFTTRVIHQTNPKREQLEGSLYRFEFRHDLRFGEPGTGRPEPARERLDQRRVRAVNFAGSYPVSQRVLADRFDVDPGDRYSFFEVRRGVNRLEEHLRNQGFLESRIRLSREEPSPSDVVLNLEVMAGPRVDFQFAGVPVGTGLRNAVREAWSRGMFDLQRAGEAIEILRTPLIEQGYLEAAVDWRVVRESETEKTVRFEIEPGVRYRDVSVEFPGADQIPPSELKGRLQAAGLMPRIHTAPRQVTDFLQRYYRQRGFLQAEIGLPGQDLQPETGTGRILIPIREGALSRVSLLAFAGNSVFTDGQLRAAVPLVIGQPYDPGLRDEAIFRLREAYSRQGYNDAVIDYELMTLAETGELTVNFIITENLREVVREIQVEGTARTTEEFVRRQVRLRPGDPLDPERLGESRRRLYNTGAYLLVDIETAEIEAAPGSPGEKPVRLGVRVREVQPYRIQYGAFYDTERGPGVIADLTNRNTVANAAMLGLRTRYDADFREARFYFGQPQLGGLPVNSSAVAFLTRQYREAAGFIVDRGGFSLQQEAEFRNRFVLNYGYRFERNRTYEFGPDPFFDITLNVAPLTASLTRDLRDDVLDATRGSFTSHSLEYAPSLLGSDLLFVRYFGQYFQYLPLSEPQEVPWSGGLWKPRFVYAGGLRLGLATGFGGQRLIPSERFFAGGGTSVRGFEQDGIGPRNVIGEPAGGQALFLLNNEIRFPLISIFDGVGFLDIGNVYSTVRDFNPFDVRTAGGFGLRIRTPYFMLRADYGLKLDRRPEEGRGQFFFSIGQAF